MTVNSNTSRAAHPAQTTKAGLTVLDPSAGYDHEHVHGCPRTGRGGAAVPS